MSQQFEGSNLTQGFAGMLAVGKTNGNYQFDLYTVIEDDKYNPNDLGFLYFSKYHSQYFHYYHRFVPLVYIYLFYHI